MTRRPWTPEETAYLERWYPRRGGKGVAKKLKRSYRSVRSKAQRLGLQVGQVPGKVTISELVTITGRNKNSIRQAALRDGVLGKAGGRTRARCNVVPEKWAAAYIKQCEAEAEAAAAGYVDVPAAARELGVSRKTVRLAVRGRGRYKGLSEARQLRGKHGKIYLNPWAVREAKEGA